MPSVWLWTRLFPDTKQNNMLTLVRFLRLILGGQTQKCFCAQAAKWAYVDTYTIPEVHILGIHSFFIGLDFDQHARPCKGVQEPTIEISGT